jgi:hypothetical protein
MLLTDMAGLKRVHLRVTNDNARGHEQGRLEEVKKRLEQLNPRVVFTWEMVI